MNEKKFEELIEKQKKSMVMLTPFSEFCAAIDRTNRQLNESKRLTERQIGEVLNLLAENIYNR